MQGRIQSLSFLPVTKKRQPLLTSVFRKCPSRPSLHHVGPLPESQKFKAGDVVPESGIYETTHENAHCEVHEVVMIKSDLFPPAIHALSECASGLFVPPPIFLAMQILNGQNELNYLLRGDGWQRTLVLFFRGTEKLN